MLVMGVETTLWLGQQFAADMARIFPKLHIQGVSFYGFERSMVSVAFVTRVVNATYSMLLCY